MRISFIMILLLFVACKCPKKAVSTANETLQDKQGLTTIISDTYGGEEEENLHVVRSKRELQKFFARVNKTRKPGIPVPEVDFEQNMVIIYCAGRQQGTDVPELVPLENKEEQLLLGIRTKKEVHESADTAITMPFIVYSMPKTEKEVVLSKVKAP